MAKKKNIGGIAYFPKRHHPDCYCLKCNKFIDSTMLAYLVGNLNSNDMVCSGCINKMYMENRVAKDKGAEAYPSDLPLYVGIKHSCLKQIYENIPFYFINGNVSKKITVKKCPSCGEFFIDTETYNKNFIYFDQYKLINSQSRKKMVRFITTTQCFHPQKKLESEIPTHLQWAAKHPYKGGGFSGK